LLYVHLAIQRLNSTASPLPTIRELAVRIVSSRCLISI
jgi:hypothetical protein